MRHLIQQRSSSQHPHSGEPVNRTRHLNRCGSRHARSTETNGQHACAAGDRFSTRREPISTKTAPFRRARPGVAQSRPVHRARTAGDRRRDHRESSFHHVRLQDHPGHSEHEAGHAECPALDPSTVPARTAQTRFFCGRPNNALILVASSAEPLQPKHNRQHLNARAPRFGLAMCPVALCNVLCTHCFRPSTPFRTQYAATAPIASAIFFASGRYCSSSFAYGMIVSNPHTRCTGA